ncbi:MAG: hypothetical protein KF718_31475 [Polyangiaceae bacterium]|nr:hypothetical protein [Polyangiaceae bacterium]
MRRLPLLLVAAALALLLGHDPVLRHARATRLLESLGRADAAAAELLETDVELPGRHGPVRARLYRSAAGAPGPGLVVAHGVHYRGIDERRLVPFARQLARAGRVVLTPELDDLTQYSITIRGADTIEDAVHWLSSGDLAAGTKVGVLGFSFAGGLALVASSRPQVGRHVEFVTSVGGHHDLARVLRFLLSDRVETPDGPAQEQAHEYGLVVLVYRYVDHFVDPEDVPAMRDTLRFWLREDRAAATARASRRVTERGERLFALLESGRLAELRPELERLLTAEQAALAALSPAGRLHDVAAPVYLLHGAGDRVIPPAETEWGARELRSRPHRALVSPLLEHVEVSGQPGVADKLALVTFMSRMM